MINIQDLIISGKVPSSTTAADNRSGYPNGWPIFADITEQVKYDWNNLPSDRVRMLKNEATYRTALEAFLLGPAPVVSVAPGPEVTLAPSVEEELNAEPPVPTSAEVVADAVVEEAVVVPTEENEGTIIDYPFGSITKVKGGWEARVDNKDGSGVQVFKGKTKDELIGKLLQSAAHASAKIRQQETERQRLIADEPADMAVERKRLAPRKLTADEQFEFAEAITSGDPTRITKAMAKRDEIVLGGSVEEVIGQVNQTRDELEFESYKAIAKTFIKQNPQVVFSKEFGDKLDEVIAENNWAYTVRNLNKALVILKEKNEVELKVSTPEVEAELPVPTSVAVPAVAAPAVKPVAAPAPKPVPPQPTKKQIEERLRPGSASTGISPRQASVRQGAAPSPAVGLTAEEYNRMSVSETRRKYKTDLGFKTAVDKLIAEGKI